jgi:hypothetical protein
MSSFRPIRPRSAIATHLDFPVPPQKWAHYFPVTHSHSEMSLRPFSLRVCPQSEDPVDPSSGLFLAEWASIVIGGIAIVALATAMAILMRVR